MSANIPSSLEGTQAPNQIEVLWERYRWTVIAIVGAIAISLGINSWFKAHEQAQINERWGEFAKQAHLRDLYSGTASVESLLATVGSMSNSLDKDLQSADLPQIERAAQSANPDEKPYLLWVLAYRSMQKGDYAKATSTLDTLENDFKDHILCCKTAYPVQYREDEKSEANKKPKPGEEPTLVPERKDLSMVSLLRERIARMKDYKEPPQFAKPEMGKDAPRVKVKLSGDWGEFVVSLMPGKAPETVKQFLELLAAKPPFFDGIKIDEIRRPSEQTSFMATASMFHFGFETTRNQPDRTQWPDKKPSEHQVAWEENDLSHFPGAIAASPGTDNKIAVDRIWICGSDDAQEDGRQVVFGYVTEGMDVIEKICQATLSNEQEEKAGRGKPSDDITIVSITKL
jgi:peptidyl-prolyl cis-trans isomerase B (cyclophilin B)